MLETQTHPYCGDLHCKQCWEEYKLRNHQEQRHLRQHGRGVPVPPQFNRYRGAQLHGCVHRAKHHKASGRCRKGCECTYGAQKAARKAKTA